MFTLTKITNSDWEFFKKLYTDDEIMKLVSDPLSDEQIKSAFESRLPEWSVGASHWLCFVIRRESDGIPMGLTGLIVIGEKDELVAEVGYMIASEFSGMSLATDSLATLLALPELAVIPRYHAVVTSGNNASVRVLEKNGFTLKEVIKDNYTIGGVMFDDWIYELNKPLN